MFGDAPGSRWRFARGVASPSARPSLAMSRSVIPPTAYDTTSASSSPSLLRSRCSRSTTELPSRATGASLRRAVAFQWFFTAFSVRPGIAAAMSAQRFPRRVCASTSASSSSSVHAPRLMSGRTWLFQRSRHCFPVLWPRPRATSLHLRHPCLCTSAVSAASSASVQPWRFLTLVARSRASDSKSSLGGDASERIRVTAAPSAGSASEPRCEALRRANASRSASIASSSMSANDSAPGGCLRGDKKKGDGKALGQPVRFPFSVAFDRLGFFGEPRGARGSRGDEEENETSEATRLRGNEGGRGGGRRTSSGLRRPAPPYLPGWGCACRPGRSPRARDLPAEPRGRARERGATLRRFPERMRIWCARARARGECPRGNARVPPRRTSSFGSSITSTASALELRGSNAGRDPPTSMTRAMTRAPIADECARATSTELAGGRVRRAARQRGTP